MRAHCVFVLPALLVACPGDPGETTGSTGTAATTSAATADSTDATTSMTNATGSTGTPTETGELPTSSTTDEVITDPLTGSTVETTSTDTSATDTSTSTSDTTASTGPGGECTPEQTQPCYSGPDGTQDVGLCVAGEQTCTRRSEWGPCLGEVVPAAESCATPGDESCDGVDPCGGAVEPQWDRVFGASGADAGVRVAFDGAGNIVLAARAVGDVDLGGGVLVGKGLTDVVLGKFAPDGEHLWSERFGDAAEQFDDGHALTVDAAGQIVLAGNFKGTLDLGGGPLVAQGVRAPFLARFTPAGAHVWSKTFYTDGQAAPFGLARDEDGNILLGGRYSVSLDLGDGAMFSAGNLDAFVGKFDADGEHVWSQRFGDAQSQAIYGLVVDAAGNVYVAGTFTGALDPGTGPLVSAGGEDVFLVRLDAGGTAEWARRFGDAAYQATFGLAIDDAGRLLLTGEMGGNVDLGGGVIPAPAITSFLAQYGSDGSHKWSRLVATGEAWASSVAYDGLGQILLTGSYTGTVDFGGGDLVAQGLDDIYALKLDGAGAHLWSASFGDFQSQAGLAVAAASTGAFAITGQFQGGVNFGGGPHTSKGNYDGFLAVFGP